ncbi:hypothetical protein FOXG_22703 [Fusarium oxysporum f. sp. lycopersici 4287]|uniref:Uncharacterized protein n=1 Tax=Fusarium oxysporum f. sp. lycopersici (strain 4287 / CBS 123668 / FGSC 9935 / NRRL 34936) TaxID=426428 RepID=A0A0J9W9G9_FUSO4|nr:hypothetical protein FOXG_22703 [Fusarium oxysporum f. sp. lycopersici 4287]EWZ78166.1 hypothetical protein FOWG_17519 [Fusarium oxysporum f. sp. lycopersici MN25]KNB19979.1 hypothetical protein FOXG_22703 [Fusarium oxysporum f. sp. lycopersici 4287]
MGSGMQVERRYAQPSFKPLSSTFPLASIFQRRDSLRAAESTPDHWPDLNSPGMTLEVLWSFAPVIADYTSTQNGNRGWEQESQEATSV